MFLQIKMVYTLANRGTVHEALNFQIVCGHAFFEVLVLLVVEALHLLLSEHSLSHVCVQVAFIVRILLEIAIC